MTKRLIPVILISIFFFTEAIAQVPTSAQVETPVGNSANFGSMVCPPGVTAFAGTSDQALFASAQSTDVEFLCLGDSMNIDHLGGQTFGDPDPSSPPGISYVFYNCPPTVSGSDFATVLTDACLITNPDPGPNTTWVVQNPNPPLPPLIDIDGNATFINEGLLQTFFNGGNPVELWFAPVTLDEFATFGFETDGVGGPTGPCINVNTTDAFRVVYLNEIQGTNINTAANGSCTGSFVAEGGLPEFDGSDYTNISVTLASDPSISAEIPLGGVTHGETVQFVVPQPGVYNVMIEDGKSCEANFTVDMSSCAALTTTASNEFAIPGSMVCVDVTASNFTNILSFQYTVSYDPAILSYSAINPINIPPDLLFGVPNPGNITVIWNDTNFPPTGQTIADDVVLYEICFTAIGNLGDVSPITFSGDLTPVEVTAADGNNSLPIGSFFNDGVVILSTNVLAVEISSCSTIANSGSFTVSVTGGTAPYNFGWVEQGNPGNTGTGTIPDGMVTGLAPGIYDVAVMDSGGEIQTASVTIANADPLFAQLDPTNPTCPSSTNGSLSLIFSGGIAPHSNVWSTGAVDVTEITGLSQGTYSVTVTDNMGCEAVASLGIGSPSISLDTLLLQHINCNGPNDNGAIRVEARGGTQPFTYVWDTGATTPDINNLIAGIYCVTATDFNGCSFNTCITVNEPTAPQIIQYDSVSVICPSDQSGSLTVIAQPGNAAITSYQWDANAFNQTTATAGGLIGGDYSVTVTDAVGCSTVGMVSLYVPAPLTVDVVTTEPNCREDNNGQIQLMLSGSTAPYNIQWENGSTFPVLPSLTCDSTYSVTISGANNCETVVENIYLDCPQAIVVTFTDVEIVTCNNGVPCDGQATAIASGGTAGTGLYNYTWSSGESISNAIQSTAVQLCQSLQTVEVNDGLCSVIDTVDIPSPTPLGIDIASTFSTPVSCFGDTDGSAMVQATGGTPGYTYAWTNPVSTEQMIDNVAAGNYSVIVTDDNGCNFSFVIEVGEPDLLVASIDNANTVDVVCNGGDNGQVAITWTGGNPGSETYTWNPNVSTTSTATNLAVGTYAVTVTDQKGCSDELQYMVSEPPAIVAIVPPPIEPMCSGDQTVVTVDTVFGGTGQAYRFSVDFGPPQFITAAIPVLSGTHTVQVFDSLGCSIEFDLFVDEPLPVLVDLGEDVTIELGDSLQLNPAIGSVFPIDTLLWDPLDFLTCPTNETLCRKPWVKSLETTLYELTVIDANGCVGTDEIIVDIDKNRNVFIPNAFSPNGDGVNDVLKVFTGPGVQQVNFFKIYDRWGEILYEDSEFLPADFYLEGWDGKFNGKDMNSAVYVYIAEVVFVDGVVLLYRGDITLIR